MGLGLAGTLKRKAAPRLRIALLMLVAQLIPIPIFPPEEPPPEEPPPEEPAPERPPPGPPPPSEDKPPQPPPQPPAEPAEAAEPQPVTWKGPNGRVSLNSDWGYRADSRNVGYRRRWYRRMPRMRPVTLPYSPNAWPVTGRRGARNWEGSVGWYRRELRIEETGRYEIRFESVHHRALVWIDGRRVRAHTGAYEPFEVRRRLGAGRHAIVVRADWRDPNRMKKEGWHRAWFNYGGINREVTIRKLGDSELRNPNLQTRLEPAPGGGTAAVVDLAVRVRNAREARELTVAGTLERGERRIPFQFEPVRLQRNRSRVVRTQVVVPEPALWSPDAPNLYELRLRVPGESSYRARVGLRQLEVRDAQPYLNGAPLFLRGASLHEEARRRGDALRAADMDRIVDMLESIGANTTRAQHPLNPALLERLDAAGILVWQGVGPFDSPGSWTSTKRKERSRAHRRVMETMREQQVHPSIFAWNLGNEIAYNGRRGGQARYIDRAARALHKQDPGRLVAVDVWGKRIPERPGLLYRNLDAIGATNYIGWYEAPHASDEDVPRILRRRLAAMRQTFPGKALVVTEFGAEANAMNPRDRHGGYRYQARLLANHLRTYRSLPDAAGMLVWNLTDFAVKPRYRGGSIVSKVPRIRLRAGINGKGLFDLRGRRKPSVEVVRAELLATQR